MLRATCVLILLLLSGRGVAADIDEVIRLAPQVGQYYRNRAVLWKALGEPGKAAQDLAKADELGDPKFQHFDGVHLLTVKADWSIMTPPIPPPPPLEPRSSAPAMAPPPLPPELRITHPPDVTPPPPVPPTVPRVVPPILVPPPLVESKSRN